MREPCPTRDGRWLDSTDVLLEEFSQAFELEPRWGRTFELNTLSFGFIW
jgi:hypothetical protein